MRANLGIADEHRQALVQLLNGALADETVLSMRLRNYHWNVLGAGFESLHQLFDTQYRTLDDACDPLAEHVRALGGRALGTFSEYLEHSRLREQPGQWPDAREMLARLLADHELLTQSLRESIQTCADKYREPATADLLTRLMRQHMQMAWRLRATLEGQS
jgi:starvation-inducible DNA-binding protein